MKKHRLTKAIAAVCAAACMLVLAVPVSAETVGGMSAVTGASYVPINIDGNYSDWADKPHTRIFYPWDTGNVYHMGALFRTDQYVYLHIKMSPFSYTTFNGYNYSFYVDGNKTNILLTAPNGGSNYTNGQNQLVVRAENGWGIISGSAGVMTRSAGCPDEWEICIPLTFFSSTPATIRDISFYTPNLGPQELIATGTPTSPYLLAGTGLVFAAGGVLVAQRKRRKLRSLPQPPAQPDTDPGAGDTQ
ncbi:MAG: Firmicu-CTERM sorting domain-containing protein [Oscillospiraceae bacterium]